MGVLPIEPVSNAKTVSAGDLALYLPGDSKKSYLPLKGRPGESGKTIAQREVHYRGTYWSTRGNEWRLSGYATCRNCLLPDMEVAEEHCQVDISDHENIKQVTTHKRLENDHRHYL